MQIDKLEPTKQRVTFIAESIVEGFNESKVSQIEGIAGSLLFVMMQYQNMLEKLPKNCLESIIVQKNYKQLESQLEPLILAIALFKQKGN